MLGFPDDSGVSSLQPGFGNMMQGWVNNAQSIENNRGYMNGGMQHIPPIYNANPAPYPMPAYRQVTNNPFIPGGGMNPPFMNATTTVDPRVALLTGGMNMMGGGQQIDPSSIGVNNLTQQDRCALDDLKFQYQSKAQAFAQYCNKQIETVETAYKTGQMTEEMYLSCLNSINNTYQECANKDKMDFNARYNQLLGQAQGRAAYAMQMDQTIRYHQQLELRSNKKTHTKFFHAEVLLMEPQFMSVFQLQTALRICDPKSPYKDAIRRDLADYDGGALTYGFNPAAITKAHNSKLDSMKEEFMKKVETVIALTRLYKGDRDEEQIEAYIKKRYTIDPYFDGEDMIPSILRENEEWDHIQYLSRLIPTNLLPNPYHAHMAKVHAQEKAKFPDDISLFDFFNGGYADKILWECYTDPANMRDGKTKYNQLSFKKVADEYVTTHPDSYEARAKSIRESLKGTVFNLDEQGLARLTFNESGKPVFSPMPIEEYLALCRGNPNMTADQEIQSNTQTVKEGMSILDKFEQQKLKFIYDAGIPKI